MLAFSHFLRQLIERPSEGNTKIIFLNYPHIGKASLFNAAGDEVNVSEGLFLWVVGNMNMLKVY